ncbi:MAG: 2-oxoacid:acceptor oxidoreductase family protein [Verrucomicrobia bacterium]|nr:2-oxoacid:acceptor oxidoreductase family protein [Verrucomicrobiota bacterium]MDA1086228.1 2-oxoacid:acceptor oxidoreductase family protein [Verrucomicrobiota bacterium]
MKVKVEEPKYPGVRQAMDGNTAVIMCERESTDAAGAYPITPSTQMGEYWAEETAKGHINISDRPLIFIEPEGEHAAAAVTAGLSMTGLRATNFSSGQGIAYMHESLYAAVGKRLTYVLNVGCRAITKSSLNVHAGHDDYHSVDDTGFFQVFGKSAQAVCDLNIIAHRIAELALNPGIVAQDGFLTTHLIESLQLPERELIAQYLGRPDDIIDTPTPAQRIIYGETRRRIPQMWDVDNPMLAGSVQNQDAYMQSVAAQRPYFFDHIREITDQCMEAFGALTGRDYKRVQTYRCDDADYLIVGQGSVIPSAEAVADYLRETRGIRIGVVDIVMFRPFPGDLLGEILAGRKGVTVLERTDQPLAEDLPLIREIRATISKCLENGQTGRAEPTRHPDHATYKSAADAPPLYSGCFGMGSRDLQPEGIVGTVENMVDDGPKRRFFYLSIDFVRDEAFTPKQEIHQRKILDGYPGIKDLAVHGSENPNLMPSDSVTVRLHSVGGWGAITTGKNLAMTLFDLLGFHIKANPKYGSEKKGQPTTYYLSAAPDPIRINCEYFFVDVVLSPDPNVFEHSNAVAGLKKGGVFIIQSDRESPAEVWASIPLKYRKIIAENAVRIYYIDAFKIAREEATDPELQFRMQGIAFQGAFFAASPVMKTAKLTEETLFKAIRDQLQAKFGGKGARVVEDNLRVVRRGFDEITEITDTSLLETTEVLRKEPDIPIMLRDRPVSEDASSDIHRFWEQTGNFYISGKGGDNLADPFIGVSIIPAATGVYRDMTQIRFDHPQWIPQNCTACGACYAACPDSAIPGLVNSMSEVFDTAVARVEKSGHAVKHLRKATRSVEKNLRALIGEAESPGAADIDALLSTAVANTLTQCAAEADEKTELRQELEWFRESINGFKFSVTKPYYANKEKDAAGSGGLLSITVNPYTCKGCMECVEVCNDDALRPVPQTQESVEHLRRDWDFWMSLPTTSSEYIRIDDLDERIGALETLLLDKNNHLSMSCGDGACMGCGEKTAMRLFVATVEALMQPRVKAQVERLDDLVARLEKHIRLRLAESMDLSDPQAIESVITSAKDRDLTLSDLSASLASDDATSPVDPDWLHHVNQLLAKLRHLRWQYTQGTTGNGRASMGIINATGCTSVWGSTYPFNPYPFPWANHLFQDSPSMAMGIFEGHMSKMADGFKAIRMAEIELDGTVGEGEHEEFFTYFNWRSFSDDEFHLCPPVVSVGGDGAMFDIGFQNLSRMMMSGKPIKALILDTQVYSNTGGQACTSGFTGQVSDMAQYGKAFKGKEEIRKEIGLIAMGHRTTFVMQGSISNVTHLIEGYIEGINARRPALFNIYSPCMPEHGIADDAAVKQSKLAVESRAFPLFRYNPDHGVTAAECFDLEGNPALDDPWPSYALQYKEEDGNAGTMDLPMTFADFAVTEGRFRKQFRVAPRDTWNENMVPLAEYLEMDPQEREDLFPYIWALDKKQQLIRVIPAAPVVVACEDRRDFWAMLKGIAGVGNVVDPDAIAAQVRTEMAKKIAAGLVQLSLGAGGADLAASLAAAPAVAPSPTPAPGGGAGAAPAPANGDGEYVAPWIDTSECTSCDECININPKIFAYNEKKLAYIKDAKGGPYKDLVRAAEKCTGGIIHPGYPADPSEKGVDKLIKRAKKFS